MSAVASSLAVVALSGVAKLMASTNFVASVAKLSGRFAVFTTKPSGRVSSPAVVVIDFALGVRLTKGVCAAIGRSTVKRQRRVKIFFIV